MKIMQMPIDRCFVNKIKDFMCILKTDRNCLHGPRLVDIKNSRVKNKPVTEWEIMFDSL